jgi:hypothetical protein
MLGERLRLVAYLRASSGDCRHRWLTHGDEAAKRRKMRSLGRTSESGSSGGQRFLSGSGQVVGVVVGS